MSEKKPLDKKPIRDLLTEKDAFLTTSEKVQEYFLRHTKAVIIAVAAVALAVIVTAIYLNQQEKAEERASLAYEDSLLRLAVSEGEGIAALEKLHADYAGRKGSRLAAFRLLALYGTRKDADKALPLAEELLRTLNPAEASLKPVLLNNIGGLYEEKKDYQQAAKSYETLLTMKHLGPNMQREVLMSLGRVYAAADRKEDAIRNYERVVNEHSQTIQAFMANAMLAELKGAPSAFPLPPEEPPASPAAPVDNVATTAPEGTAAEEAPAAPVDEEVRERMDGVEVELEEGAPLPPDAAAGEDQADGKAAAEPGAE